MKMILGFGSNLDDNEIISEALIIGEDFEFTLEVTFPDYFTEQSFDPVKIVFAEEEVARLEKVANISRVPSKPYFFFCQVISRDRILKARLRSHFLKKYSDGTVKTEIFDLNGNAKTSFLLFRCVRNDSSGVKHTEYVVE